MLKIKYDLTTLPPPRNSPKQGETLQALKLFMASKHENMCITYESENEAKARLNTLNKFRRLNNLQEMFDIYRKEKDIYVIRKKK